jgi:methylaspartate ammonia-lyase
MASTNSNALYEALKAQFVAQQQKAIATLTVYLTNPVGIGEHPQIIDEMVEQTKSLAEAEDCLERLKDTFEVKETKSEGVNE